MSDATADVLARQLQSVDNGADWARLEASGNPAVVSAAAQALLKSSLG
jgi:hypothetical protein